MKKLILLFGIISLSWLAPSCQDPTSGPDYPALHADTLVNILVDMHLSDAGVVAGDGGDEPAASDHSARHLDVLQRHHVTQEDFRQSMRYYSEHPDELVEIYDQVIESLTRLQGKAPR